MTCRRWSIQPPLCGTAHFGGALWVIRPALPGQGLHLTSCNPRPKKVHLND